MTEGEIIYFAMTTQFGTLVRGSAKKLREARSSLVRDDPALVDLVILGPDLSGTTWVVRKDSLRKHLIV
jgi:hypothetical protein